VSGARAYLLTGLAVLVTWLACVAIADRFGAPLWVDWLCLYAAAIGWWGNLLYRRWPR
jgi:hypothetical protein